ncbi:MAG TPA: hypothetical protein VIM31_01790 [Candidatus Microsaccharimonas sp.]|jgi:hypothetical protein
MNESSAKIVSTIAGAKDQFEDWFQLDLKKPHAIHIAVMVEPYLSYIFDGSKTAESRFTLNRIAPYKQATVGDLVFLKAGPIVGCFTIAWIKDFDLTEYPIELIKEEYTDAICVDETFWNEKRDKRYATLLGISKVCQLTPVEIPKKDRRAWVTISLHERILKFFA